MRFVAYVSTDRVGSKVTREFEVPDEDLKGLDTNQRENLLNDWAHDIVFDNSMFEWGWDEA